MLCEKDHNRLCLNEGCKYYRGSYWDFQNWNCTYHEEKSRKDRMKDAILKQAAKKKNVDLNQNYGEEGV